MAPPSASDIFIFGDSKFVHVCVPEVMRCLGKMEPLTGGDGTMAYPTIIQSVRAAGCVGERQNRRPHRIIYVCGASISDARSVPL